MGNAYTFRVFAENKVGRSETAAVTKDAAHIQKTGEVSTCYCFIPMALQTSPIKLTWFLKKRKKKINHTLQGFWTEVKLLMYGLQ